MTGTANLPANLLNGGILEINNVPVTLVAGMTPGQIEAAIDTAMDTNVPPIAVEASIVGGKLVLAGADADTSVNIGGTPPPAMMTELGLSIGAKAVGNAIARNRVKRVVRESFRHVAPELAGLDVVVGARNGARSAHNAQLRESLDGLWKKIRERCVVS